MAKTDFASSLMKAIDNPYVSVADEGKSAGSLSNFIDTGSYALNAVISGSLFGGVPDNKITMFAGEESTGKTFFALSIVKHFLSLDENNLVFYFESEGAVSREMLIDRGIDAKRVIIAEVSTAEGFRNNAVQLINKYLETDKKERGRLLCVLDSLGMLSTEKESGDAAEGKNTRDMTRAQVMKSTFRTITLKLSRAQVPFIVVNHVYATMDQYSPKEVGGGSGAKYAASTTITLTKAKASGGDAGGASSDKTRVGAIISCTAHKSRLTIEQTKVKTLLHYKHGLDPYFGLFDIAKEAGLFVKQGLRWHNTLTDEVKYKKDIVHPKKAHETFTQEFLVELDKYVQKTFNYGAIDDDIDVDVIDVDDFDTEKSED